MSTMQLSLAIHECHLFGDSWDADTHRHFAYWALPTPPGLELDVDAVELGQAIYPQYSHLPSLMVVERVLPDRQGRGLIIVTVAHDQQPPPPRS